MIKSMCRLIESIKLVDGKFHNLFYHEQRMQRSLEKLYGRSETVDLEKFLSAQAYPRNGLYKCRIVYDDVSRDTTFAPYTPREIRRIRIVEEDHIAYEFKFLDRQAIDRLFDQRGECDDVLIIRRGKVTDCSFSNIVFRRGREWFTPVSPLLKGTMRQQLLEKNKIREREILKSDIRSFDTFKIINAMLEFESPEIEVSDIVF